MQARRREGGREDSDAAAEGTGQPALLPRDQRASERKDKRETDGPERERREKREERERAPHETHKKAYPRSLSKRRGGGPGRVATHRDGSAFSSRGVHRQPGPLQQHEPGRDGTGAGGPGCARDLGCGGGARPAGRWGGGCAWEGGRNSSLLACR